MLVLCSHIMAAMLVLCSHILPAMLVLCSHILVAILPAMLVLCSHILAAMLVYVVTFSLPCCYYVVTFCLPCCHYIVCHVPDSYIQSSVILSLCSYTQSTSNPPCCYRSSVSICSLVPMLSHLPASSKSGTWDKWRQSSPDTCWSTLLTLCSFTHLLFFYGVLNTVFALQRSVSGTGIMTKVVILYQHTYITYTET